MPSDWNRAWRELEKNLWFGGESSSISLAMAKGMRSSFRMLILSTTSIGLYDRGQMSLSI